MESLGGSAKWTTSDEIYFIYHIGIFVERHKGKKDLVKSLLEGYIEGCQKRIEWGPLDPVKVISHAMNRLHSLN